jgi:hypothetical protein
MSSESSSLVHGDPLAPTLGAHPTDVPAKWRQNPERLAWIVLLGSFAIFVILAITLPLGARYVIRYATVSQEARLEPTLGTLLFYPSPSAEPVAVTSIKEGIGEGSRIVAADESTQGSLAFISDNGDAVLGSVQLYAGATLDVLRVRRPFFSRSTEPYTVRLYLVKGQARIFSNSEEIDARPLRVDLETPHGLIALGTGSYQVSVNEEQTEITARSGRAVLAHQSSDGSISINADQSAWMTTDDYAHEPESASRNLLRNGDFSEPELDAWQTDTIADDVIPGSVKVDEGDGRWVALFFRDGEDNVNTEVSITQIVEKDVNVYDELSIQLDVKLLHQSLPGAGYLSSEFPLRVEITYTDIYGKVLTWGHGFYYRDPEDKNWKIIDGEKIPPYSWYTYQSPNLIEFLADKGTRPARINSVRIYASGWNYQSMVSEVYLVAE